MALSTRRCTHEDKCLLYAKALYQIPVSGFLYTLSEGISRCRRLIRTGGYALAHLSPFFENISPNKFRSDIFSNPKTSQSPCRERGLSDQWRMRPLLSIQTSHDQTHSTIQIPQSVLQLSEGTCLNWTTLARKAPRTNPYPPLHHVLFNSTQTHIFCWLCSRAVFNFCHFFLQDAFLSLH